MTSFNNIEKSAFHAGQYVGYSGGRVYRIKRSNSTYGTWWAWRENAIPGDAANLSLYGHTLKQLSERLAALPAPAFDPDAYTTRDRLREEIANTGDC